MINIVERTKEFFSVNRLEDLEVIIPEEVNGHINFYYFPDDKRIAVTREGTVLIFKTGKILKGSKNKLNFGKVYFHITNGADKRNTYQHHRIIARTFIGRPSRHLDKKYSKLEVNHVDGDRENYSIANLEWVTGKENAVHSHKNGLNPKDKTTLAMNLKTKEILFFNSNKECADFFDIHRATLWKHLISGNSGKYYKDNHIFKFNNGTPWNIIPLNTIRLLGDNDRIADFVITSLVDGKKILLSTYIIVASFIGISTKHLYRKLNKKKSFSTHSYLIEKLSF